LSLKFTPMVSLQLEPSYFQKGAKIHTAQTGERFIIEVDQSIQVNYIDVPVLFKLTFGNEAVKPYFLGGGYIAFLLSEAKIEMEKATANGKDVINIAQQSCKQK
jgi:Outer membrane protein beta-barrel domain